MKIVREYINEAFERKSKNISRKELLYPGISKIEDVNSLMAGLESGIPLEVISDDLLSSILSKTNSETLSRLISFLEEKGINIPYDKVLFNLKAGRGYNIYTMFKALEKAGLKGLTRRQIIKSMYSEKEWEETDPKTRRGIGCEYFNYPEWNHTYFMIGVDNLGSGVYKLNNLGKKYIKQFEEKNNL